MTFASVYQILTPLTTLRKTKSWYWFDGDALRSIWTASTRRGSSINFVMVDAIDQGLEINFGVGDNIGALDQNNIRHYSETASVIITMVKRETGQIATRLTQIVSGFRNNAADVVSSQNSMQNNSSLTFIRHLTSTQTGASATDTSVAVHGNFTTVKIECRSADCRLTLDGILETTKTTNLPNARLQLEPLFLSTQGANAETRRGRVRYCEAFST